MKTPSIQDEFSKFVKKEYGKNITIVKTSKEDADSFERIFKQKFLESEGDTEDDK